MNMIFDHRIVSGNEYKLMFYKHLTDTFHDCTYIVRQFNKFKEIMEMQYAKSKV